MEFRPQKKLGFGLMRMPLTDPSDESAVDIEQVKKMADDFLAAGFTYFDTAWLYHGFKSEDSVKAILTDRYPRDSFTLATKLHAGFIKEPADRDRIFNEQLRKTGVSYFDYYLLHGVDVRMLRRYERFDCFTWLLEKKQQGLVRHIGFSFHDTPDLLDDILTKHPEIEFVQLQLNYLDWESPWIHSGGCYETAVKHGKPVIVMEPVKGGTLARIPEAGEKVFKDADPGMSVPSWAIRFAASLPDVMVVLSGMSNTAQMADNISYMREFTPLTEEEKALCFKVRDIINSKITVPCTGCSYCTAGCPKHIAIPQYFSMYNEDMREHLEEKGFTINYSNYDTLTKSFGKAGDCIECGQCESVCPQHLPIIRYLKDVSAHYDKK